MRGEWARRALLWVHAESTILTGILIWIGGPDRLASKSLLNLARLLPWSWPYLWGAWIFLGGMVLTLGLVLAWLRVVQAGLFAIAAWYVLLTGNFVYTALHGGREVPLYPISVYITLSSLIIVHMIIAFDELRGRSDLRHQIRESQVDIDLSHNA